MFIEYLLPIQQSTKLFIEPTRILIPKITKLEWLDELELKQLLFQDKNSGIMFFGLIIITNRRIFYEEIMCFDFPKTRKFWQKMF
jgi:hypothetical protein